MADLCTCQRPGIEAAAKFLNERALDAWEQGFSTGAADITNDAEGIRALLTTPTAPCPRCEVVAAGEEWSDLIRTGSMLPHVEERLLRAIERMRS